MASRAVGDRPSGSVAPPPMTRGRDGVGRWQDETGGTREVSCRCAQPSYASSASSTTQQRRRCRRCGRRLDAGPACARIRGTRTCSARRSEPSKARRRHVSGGTRRIARGSATGAPGSPARPTGARQPRGSEVRTTTPAVRSAPATGQCRACIPVVPRTGQRRHLPDRASASCHRRRNRTVCGNAVPSAGTR